MRKLGAIKILKTYQDWLIKAQYDFDRYKKNRSVYALTDCLLTLNAIPEWIISSDKAPQQLKDIAESKISIMKGEDGFKLDEDKIGLDTDHTLRFVRMFCNHSKHKKRYRNEVVFESIEMVAIFPVTFPIKWDKMKVGNIYRIRSYLNKGN